MQAMRDKTVKAAVIGGIFVIIAAIIGGLFLIFSNKVGDQVAKRGTFDYKLERIDAFSFPKMICTYDRLKLQNGTDRSISNITGMLKKGFFPLAILRIIPHSSLGVNTSLKLSPDGSEVELSIDNLNPGEFVSFDILVQWREFIHIEKNYNSLDVINFRGPGVTAIKAEY